MSKVSKSKKILVEQILDKAGLAYDSIVFDQLTEIEKNNLPPIYKTLALAGDKTGPIIGIVPVTAHLDEKKLAKVSGNKKVTMIALKDLQKTTGYVHGANNPIGIRHKHRYPIYIDQTALKTGQIVVSAGDIGRSIAINSRQLADFVNASFADLKE